jgi:proline iminopeptidase
VREAPWKFFCFFLFTKRRFLAWISFMHICLNDTTLFVDTDGPRLVPDGPAMRERPVLVLLHGGPGLDHSMFKPDFAPLTGVAQLLYVDLRGNGRSDLGRRADWTLAQWGDDVQALCVALRIRRPIVLGLSWGGFVAQAYATRHPDHAGGLILESTAARWPGDDELAGLLAAQAGIAARIAGGAWAAAAVERPSLAGAAARRADPDVAARYVQRPAVGRHFFAGEAKTMDFRPVLSRVACKTLVLAGDHDQTLPLPLALELADALPDAETHVFHGCDHGVHADAPARTMALIRGFIEAVSG